MLVSVQIFRLCSRFFSLFFCSHVLNFHEKWSYNQREKKRRKDRERVKKRHIPKSSITAATAHRTGLRKLFLAIKVI